MFCWFFVFFFQKKFQSCAKHIWISDHNRRDGGETGKGGRGKEGETTPRLERKKGTATLLFGNHKQKMHSSGLKRLNQTPTPVCTGIYSGASRGTHRAHAPRVHTHAHPHAPRHRPTAKARKRNRTKPWRHSKRNETPPVWELTKTSIKQGTSFEFVTVEKERRDTESQRKTRPEPLARTFHPEKR